MAKIKALFKKYREVIFYLIVGGLTTLVSWGSFALFQLILDGLMYDAAMQVFVSNVLSWIAAVLFSFFANKIWVFESRSFKAGVLSKELASFVASRLATGAVEWLGVPLLMNIGLGQAIFGIEGMLAKIIVSIIVVILNYVFGKLIVFRKKKSENSENGDAPDNKA